MVKNTLLWLVVIGVLVLVFSNFDTNNQPDKLNYSQFVTQVTTDQIKSVKIDGEQITGEKKNGSTFETVRPLIQDNELMPKLMKHNVVLFGEMLIDEPAYLSQHLSEFDTIVIAGTSLTVTSVFPCIRPSTDVYIVNKEAVELPLPTGFFKSVNYIGGDIIDGLAQLQQIFADKMS